jgi:biopolymer transport protein ExbB
MLEILQKGGPLMWLILLCSVIAFGVFSERLLYLHKATIRIGELLGGLALLIRNGRLEEALAECSANTSPVARILQAALLHPDKGREELQSFTTDAAMLEIPKLERNLPTLAALSYIAPLLGLLGTILGLLDAFQSIASHGGYATATELSRGVYESLLDAAAGLAVAIPSYLGHCYLASRVNDLIQDMQRAGIEVVTLLLDARDSRSPGRKP